MKHKLLIGCLVGALFAVACSAPATNTATTTTNTTATTTTNRTTAPAPAAANAAATAPASTTAPAGTNAPAAGAQDFTLVNGTDVTIDKVYISPHTTNDWEEDILGRDTLPPGETVDITFDRSERAAKWDLRVEDKDGNALEWENLNLLAISKVTLHYKDGRAWADTE